MRPVPFRGREDLAAMQRLVQRTWTPGARWHVGDLAWERRLRPAPDGDWPTRLWLDDTGEVAAWAWLALDELAVLADPDAPSALDAALDWALERKGIGTLSTTVMAEDHAMRTALESRGFAVEDRAGFTHLLHDLESIPVATCPPGFTAAGLERSERALVTRVAVHRAAWESTTMTDDVYRTLQATWPYRHDLDVVVEVDASRSGGDLRFVASCLAWLDDVNSVGELEPVGTDPRFRRRGLAAAACAEALRQLRAAGATRAVVYATTDPNYAAPAALYRSLGFKDHASTVAFVRRAP